MSKSIILGIRNISDRSDAAMIIPGDIPLMSSEIENRLATQGWMDGSWGIYGK